MDEWMNGGHSCQIITECVHLCSRNLWLKTTPKEADRVRFLIALFVYKSIALFVN